LGDLRAELFDRLGDLRAERLGDLRAELFDRLGDLRAERLGDFFLGERLLPDMLNFIIEHDIYYEILK
jgi:hypothetical protein